ncbi:glycosyltransferase family 4 protein [Clostridia bacterium]|nr:glycosyltransferase family 4 protein [Clostridia bacterium]
MKILWLTNIPLPEASLLLNEIPSPFGGWLINASRDLSDQNDIELSIAFPRNDNNDLQILKGKKINYYSFPKVDNEDTPSLEGSLRLKMILDKVKPSIVHIFGTEYAHSLAMVNACNDKGIETVISIQGLVSIIAKHYMACLPDRIQKRFTFRDFIRQDNLKQQQKKFSVRGKSEIEAIQKVNHVIGRTTWDKACVTQINSKVQYHFCNETLRDEFYKHIWDIDKCERFSIFLSQVSYPIKGLHFMLQAMPLILKRFPNTKLYIAGHNITKSDTLKEKLKKTSYAKYITELIKKYNLMKNVVFTGLLNEKKMCERYLKSNVFVCPSSIENSPNSLGEAMILGVPCVASDVGGVADMLKHKEEGFVYQSDAPYMLAYYVCELFQNENLALNFSRKASDHALETHDREKNTKRLIEIYRNIA